MDRIGEIYSMPGFVDDMVEAIGKSARYPNRPLAFAASLALLSFLTGGRVQAPTGLRTNLMVMGLADSGVGKDDGRKAALEVIDRSDLDDHYVSRFGSGEALQDAMLAVKDDPRIFCMTDEVSYMLARIKNDRTGSQDMLISELLQIYSASQSTYKTRTLAGKPGEKIRNPHLAFYGTATPERFYAAMSASMAEGGFAARLVIIEAGNRGQRNPGCSPVIIRHDMINYARYWSGVPMHDGPATMVYTDVSQKVMDEYAEMYTVAYEDAQASRDAAGMSIWSRADEMTIKLSILRALSREPTMRTVEWEDAEWAGWFVLEHSRMLHAECVGRVAESDFHAKQQRLVRILEDDGATTHSAALRRMHVSAKEMREVVESLVEAGRVVVHTEGARRYELTG